MAEWGWLDRESEFRARSKELVEQHWAAISAVATELLTVDVLEDTEVAIICDQVAGVAVFPNLAQYRALRPSQKSGA